MAHEATPQRKTVTFQHGFAKDRSAVVVIASEPVQQMHFSPKEAVSFALNMLEGARDCDPASVEGITWPKLDRKLSG